jgi:hypothetical protein
VVFGKQVFEQLSEFFVRKHGDQQQKRVCKASHDECILRQIAAFYDIIGAILGK